MQWIKDTVTGLIETYGTRDIYELIDMLDIEVVKKDFQGNQKASFFRDIFQNEFIYLSSSLNKLEERFVLAHELGHAILHDYLTSEVYYSTFINKDKLEHQADCFAAELIINESDIDKPLLRDMSLDQLSCYFGVPKDLLEYRFEKQLVNV